MNIVLTGSTSPIGKIIHNHLLQRSFNVTVVGRDLYDTQQQDTLVDITKNSDVFINSAHIGYLQGVLLEKSQARTNISFTSLITQYPWSITQTINTPEYISQKLFLEHVHSSMNNSVLVSISNYGKGPVPSITDCQVTDAIDSIIDGKVEMSSRIEVSNGLGDLSRLIS
jgi:hypothetical protein